MYLYKVTASQVTLLSNGKPVLHFSTINKKSSLGLFPSISTLIIFFNCTIESLAYYFAFDRWISLFTIKFTSKGLSLFFLYYFDFLIIPMFLSSLMLLPLWVTYIHFSIEVLREKVSKIFIITSK